METKVKYFTPGEAKRTLPLVKKIVQDILAEAKEFRLIIESKEQVDTTDPEIKDRLQRIDAYIQELSEIGCYYKDWNFSLGLVDFPAIINGKEVFLCWRSDEESITYYHDLESGYAGRKLIPEEYFYN